MKGLLLDTLKQKASFVDVENSLDAFYQAIHADIVEYVYRKIGTTEFVFVCDEEGLCKENLLSAVNTSMEIELVGSLLVFGIAENGDFRELTKEEIELLKSKVAYVSTIQHPTGLLVIRDIEKEV